MISVFISHFAKFYSPYKNEYVSKFCKGNIDYEPTKIEKDEFKFEEYELKFNTISNTREKGDTRADFFEKGISVERKIIHELKKKGYCVSKQQEFAMINIEKIRLKGKIDGEILLDDKSMLLEVKSKCGYSTINPTVADIIQCQIYMYLFKYDKCLLIIEKDGSLNTLILDYDIEVIKKLFLDCCRLSDAMDLAK